MNAPSKHTLRRMVKKNTNTLIAAYFAVLAVNKRMAASINLFQSSANIKANDLELSDDERNVAKAWNDVWISMDELANAMQRAGWIDGKRVQASIEMKLRNIPTHQRTSRD